MVRAALIGCLAAALAGCAAVAAPSTPPPAATPAVAAVATPALPPYRAEQPLVILVSIDGFRFDYLQRGVTPTLAALAAEGVWAEQGMRPSFPSVTFPNHYTLVTGVRPDRHGVVANIMEDASIQPDHRFTTGNYAAVGDRRWWDGAEPIWVSARKGGVRTATLFWPGSEAPVRGVRPDLWAHFDDTMRPALRVDYVLDWLDAPRPPGLITLYFEHVDTAGHEYGTNSPELTTALREVDAAIGRLVDGLKARGLAQRANLVIVADHGMMDTPVARHVFVEDWAPADSFTLIETGAAAGFEPRSSEAEAALLQPHAHAICRRKADLPAALRFGSHPRVPPIYCLAEPGYHLTTREADAKRERDGRPPIRGTHGYDPVAAPEMGALFLAAGPAFRRGYRQPAFDNVDVQPLLMHLLGLAQTPGVDGDLGHLQGGLVP
jgi:predicted AlkP superfamily pyrophosphatase or phosphodiesterase